jgi:hypothetical protein
VPAILAAMPDSSPSLVIISVIATGALLAGITRLILPASRRPAWSTTVATGGSLLLGIDDDGAIHGLDDDHAVVPGRDRDGFELWLRTLLAERLGRAVTADFYLRVGNATRRLLTDEVLDYRARRWP